MPAASEAITVAKGLIGLHEVAVDRENQGVLEVVGGGLLLPRARLGQAIEHSRRGNGAHDAAAPATFFQEIAQDESEDAMRVDKIAVGIHGAQAIGVDAHFYVQQFARAAAGKFLNFNGTAGMWRVAAIEDALRRMTDSPKVVSVTEALP